MHRSVIHKWCRRIYLFLEDALVCKWKKTQKVICPEGMLQ